MSANNVTTVNIRKGANGSYTATIRGKNVVAAPVAEVEQAVEKAVEKVAEEPKPMAVENVVAASQGGRRRSKRRGSKRRGSKRRGGSYKKRNARSRRNSRSRRSHRSHRNRR